MKDLTNDDDSNGAGGHSTFQNNLFATHDELNKMRGNTPFNAGFKDYL